MTSQIFYRLCGMKHSETDLRTRKLIAIVVAVSNNPPDARAKKYENCQGERPPSRVLGVLRQIGEHRQCPRLCVTYYHLSQAGEKGALSSAPKAGGSEGTGLLVWATQTCESLRK